MDPSIRTPPLIRARHVFQKKIKHIHIHVYIHVHALTLFPHVIFICLLLSCVQVCTTGYIANKPIKDPSTKAGLTIKRLLFTDFRRIGKGLAVMLVFNQPPPLGVCVVTQ